MIKFFRTIRQRMIQENRFSRYFLYAIGEIVLVVIGILIALQINNWNEHRKHILRQVDLIDALILDLNEKKVENIDDLAFGEKLMLKAEKAMGAMASGGYVDTADVKLLLRNMAADEWFYVTTTPTYTSIINSDLWQQLPDTLAKRVQFIYDHKSTGLQVCFEKHSEYATNCKVTYLAPNELLNLEQGPMDMSMKIAEDPKAFRVQLSLFMNGVYRLIRYNSASRDAIAEAIPILISYRESLANNPDRSN